MYVFLNSNDQDTYEGLKTGVTEETLSLQLLGGKLKLENLRIRETALAEIELPVCASGSKFSREAAMSMAYRSAP